MNIQTVELKVDGPDEILKGYNHASRMLEQHQFVSVIPYAVPSAMAVGYCQAIIDYCRNEQAKGAKLYKSE